MAARFTATFLAMLWFAMTTLPGAATPVTPPNPTLRPNDLPRLAHTPVLEVAAALARNEGARALDLARRAPSGLIRDTALWLVARARVDGLPPQTRLSLLDQLPNWPDRNRIQRLAEVDLFEDDPAPQEIARVLGRRDPVGFEGRILTAERLLANGEREAASRLIRPMWHTARLSEGTENLILRTLSGVLSTQDHALRAHHMLYDGETDAARRLLARLSATDRALVEARIAVQRDTQRGLRAMASLSPGQRANPHVLFSYAQALRRAERFTDAAALIATAPRQPDALLDADAWWVERRVLARELLEKGQAQQAHDVIANRATAGAGSEADAEFHAGWIALRFMQDPGLAERHFRALVRLATLPLTLSRAHYWLGRALDAAGKANEARTSWREAARYPETFYGQIAQTALGEGAGVLPRLPSVAPSERHAFEARPFVRALRMIEAAGLYDDADALVRAIAQANQHAAEWMLLAEIAVNAGDHNGALTVGRLAASRDRALLRLAYPTEAIPEATRWPQGLEPAVGYAIARQESAFNPQAVSSAGALGLLQLMPATARRVAQTINLPFSQDRLTSDAAYNATLGTHHLAELVSAQNGSYILTFAGYNAGSGRLPGWIERFGDPRSNTTDMIDWIELIPFTETRNYVQRVLENVTVYRTLLAER